MTIYFHKTDYRADMQNPTGAQRAHAICRRLTGVGQHSPLYGCLYWAACAMLHMEKSMSRTDKEAYGKECSTYFQCWMRDSLGRASSLSCELKKSLWARAGVRVLSVLWEAKALESSVLW